MTVERATESSSESSHTAAAAWQVGPNRSLPLDRPQLMGVLNMTPDSFSDGGQNANLQWAIEHAMQMIEQGASIIDVGGESTRPGAARVDASEQIARTLPLIEALREQIEDMNVLISIDTTLHEVAARALECGANIINDVSGGNESSDMFQLAAKYGCGLVLMHRRVPPDKDRYSHEYEDEDESASNDIAIAVRDWLMQRVGAAVDAGVASAAIAIDPGLGFGKNVQQNYQLIADSALFVRTGHPVLSAASRKSFIGAVTGQDEPTARVMGSAAVSVLHYVRGVRLFRVHDVAAHAQALKVAAAVDEHADPSCQQPC